MHKQMAQVTFPREAARLSDEKRTEARAGMLLDGARQDIVEEEQYEGGGAQE